MATKKIPAKKIVRETFATEVARLGKITPAVNKKKLKSNKKLNTFDLQLIVDDILDSIKSMANKPLVILSFFLVVGIVITHQSAFREGIIGKWVYEHKSTNAFANWVQENNLKFLGAVIFVPTLFDIPKSNQIPVTVGAIFWIMLVPEYSIYEYVIQSFALHTFFRVKRSTTRTALLIFVAVCYYFGVFTKIKVQPATDPRSRPSG